MVGLRLHDSSLYPLEVEEDRRSTSTVASTVGTGGISLASRLQGLTIDFSEKLHEDEDEDDRDGCSVREEGDEDPLQGRSEGHHEVEDDDGTRSELRSVGTAATNDNDGEGDAVAGEPSGEGGAWGPPHHRHEGHEHGGRRGSGRRRRSSLVSGVESPEHTSSHRLPFQICSRLFVAKGNVQLKKMLIGQVEELKQHGYVVIDNFISRELALQVKMAALMHHSKGRMMEAPRLPLDAACARAACASASTSAPATDLIMPLVIGKPPADSTPLALVLVALQELYEDLHEFTRLHRALGEYQLSLQLPGSPGVPRHRDALPDGGRKRGQRRLTCMVCCGGASTSGPAPAAVPAAAGAGPVRREDGGAVSVWPPRRMAPSMGSSALVSERHGVRRSLTGSEAGTSFTESDTCSLRSHYVGGSYLAPSVTSSMWAEAASALDQRERDDNASLDNVSMSESIDGYAAAAVASYANYAAVAAGGGAGVAAVLGAALSQAHTLPGSAAALAAAEARSLSGNPGGGGVGAEGANVPPASAATAAPVGVEWVEQDGEMVLEVAPLPGRLLVFLSGAVDHAHQPVGPGAEVAAVTAWYQ